MELTIHDIPDEPVAKAIAEVCAELTAFLIGKNKKYGNSALDPLRIFSRVDTVEQIKVRLDDKLSRIKRGDPTQEDEDVEQDMLGYLVLLRVARRLKSGN